ncbi:MAG: hypothetical protein PVSMB5_14810 [Ktedonobacteraceae bacterium]
MFCGRVKVLNALDWLAIYYTEGSRAFCSFLREDSLCLADSSNRFGVTNLSSFLIPGKTVISTP